MNILIMGGTEFVSRSVAEHYIELNYTVDIFTRGKKEVPYTGYRHHHIGDRHNLKDLEQLKSFQYEYVIDISAYTKNDVSNLLETINTDNLKRYVFCSSGAVYAPNRNMITEEDEKGPNHNWLKYGLDKLEAETHLMEAFNKKALPVTIFRPTYIYGPNNNLYRESYFFDAITHNRPIPYPNSNNQTQFIHIHDLMLIIQSMLENDVCIGEAYNVTHEAVYDFESILDTFEHVTDITIDRIPVDTNTYNISRRYFPYRDVNYTLSIEKLKKHGLHVPKFDLKTGLKQTYKWYQQSYPKLSDKAMTLIDDIIKTRA
ncbi:MAG: NAD-dependent epimerase/dehydratase family protein [Clostridiales bacterium]|nr:NAD-dependent epimerase/dehydratase family protein [Clostridiales bacterium]